MNFLSKIGQGSTHAGLGVLASLAMNLLPASAAPYAGAVAGLFAFLAMLVPDTGTVGKPAQQITTEAKAAPVPVP